MRNSMRLKYYMYVDRSHMFISFKMVIKVVRKLFLSFLFEKTLCLEIHSDFTEMVTAHFIKFYEKHVEIFFFQIDSKSLDSRSNDMRLMIIVQQNYVSNSHEWIQYIP